MKTKLEVSDKEFPQQEIFHILFFIRAMLVKFFIVHCIPFSLTDLKFIIEYKTETCWYLIAMHKFPSIQLSMPDNAQDRHHKHFYSSS